MENMIKVYPNIITEDFAKHLIQLFDESPFKERGGVATGNSLNVVNTEEKTAYQLYTDTAGLWEEDTKLHEVFGECLSKYIEDVGIKAFGNGSITDEGYKIKKYPVGGYHAWHYDNRAESVSKRLLAAIIYLNDVKEGGETEFLYQDLRVKPEIGKVVIFPPYWTHYHRSKETLSEPKYTVSTFFLG